MEFSSTSESGQSVDEAGSSFEIDCDIVAFLLLALPVTLNVIKVLLLFCTKRFIISPDFQKKSFLLFCGMKKKITKLKRSRFLEKQSRVFSKTFAPNHACAKLMQS